MKTLPGLKSERKDGSRYPRAGRTEGLSHTEGPLSAAATLGDSDVFLTNRSLHLCVPGWGRGAGKSQLMPPSLLYPRLLSLPPPPLPHHLTHGGKVLIPTPISTQHQMFISFPGSGLHRAE